MTAIVATAVYTAYWYYTAAEVRAAIAEWSAHRRAAGWQVEIGHPYVRGFPSNIEVHLYTPRLAGPKGRWSWEASKIWASARPWSPGAVTVFAPGTHVYSSNKAYLRAEFERAVAEIKAGVSGDPEIIVRLGVIKLQNPAGSTVQAEQGTIRVTGNMSTNPVEKDTKTGTGVTVDIRSIMLPTQWGSVLGRKLARLSIDALVSGEIVPGSSVSDSLGRWRDSGGAIEISGFNLDWNALVLSAEGTFALDHDLQPQGAMTADIRGIDRTTDQLIAAGIIDARTAFVAKLANRALSLRGKSQKLPFSIQGQKLFMGPVPLLKLKALRWD
jgi:hypothetical protein